MTTMIGTIMTIMITIGIVMATSIGIIMTITVTSGIIMMITDTMIGISAPPH